MFGVDLTRRRVWSRKSWAWFEDLVSHLLVTDTPTGRLFNPAKKPTEAPDV